jgi:hypothetical protein
MTKTSQKIDNSPSDSGVIWNLQILAENILEVIRSELCKPVTIHSAYRSPAVNKAIGGSSSSQHMKGLAADFHVKGISNHALAEWIQENLDFDQLILENYIEGIDNSGWIHCSFSPKNLRYQVLTKFKGSKIYHPGLLK